MRLDLLVIARHPHLSRRRAREVIEKGQVRVDGALVREAGREVSAEAAVDFDPNRPALPVARCSLPILYQDEHVVVVDKPAGLLTVPSAAGVQGEDTVLQRIQEYARHLKPRDGYAERVHRLDRDTSGALAFALSAQARAGLIATFRDHRIERSYLAVVAARPREPQGVIEAPLREAWISGRKAVARPGEPARPALTRWRVEESLGSAALLEVELETGRQHQIRVHLAHQRMPILGDTVYGTPDRLARRPMLHAWKLAFAHPVHGAPVAVESPVPEDMREVLAALRRDARTRRR